MHDGDDPHDAAGGPPECVAEKRIAVLGFAFKKDTNDTRGSPAIWVVRDLLSEKSHVAVYDPRVAEEQIVRDVLGPGRENVRLSVATSAESAVTGAHACVVRTEWHEFRGLDFARLCVVMPQPTFAFDGRNILPLEALREIGSRAFTIGKPSAA